jgi:hypothetical protein
MAHPTHRRPRLALLVAAIVLSALPVALPHAEGDAPLETALSFFTRHEAAGILDRFDSIRPIPVTAAERQHVLATLPAEGDVHDLNAVQRKKLTAATRVLELHGREAVYVIKVVAVPQAAVALHARTVVLVSEPALELLDSAELQALVAHEVGHEYFWNEYHRARRDDDRPRLRTLELLCDGVAIATLRGTGSGHPALISALDKMIRYNRDRFGAARNEDHYPAIEARRQFANRFVRWLGGVYFARAARQ